VKARQARAPNEIPLRILHLEDDPADAALVESTLKADGIACATTRCRAAMSLWPRLKERR